MLRFSIPFLASLIFASASRGESKIDFTRQIRPLLADRCFQCHGPDKKKRRGGLRLDTLEGYADIVTPGKPDQSELYRRITSTNQRNQMPPLKSGKKLSAEEIQLLRQWIQEGAERKTHWAFLPPLRPPLPKVQQRSWTRNPIDHFILARLEKESIKPSKRAGKSTLIRRLYLDLIGLPPAEQDLDRLQKMEIDQVIDHLLASPHFAERVAIPWLDQARYADTNGFSIDDGRDMWLWRDWVLHAINSNMPFDQFTIEQLAGDLLPDATIHQRVATGFNRNNMNTHEGGTIPEEYRTIYVADRTRTTAETWMGLTMGCAQCHDHKYDPITQKDYYRFFAFFNNIPEKGNDGHAGVNSVPYIKAPSILSRDRLASLKAEIEKLQKQRASYRGKLAQEQRQWEERIKSQPKSTIQAHPLKITSVHSRAGMSFKSLSDGSMLCTSKKEIPSDVYTISATVDAENVTGIRLEVLPDRSLPLGGPGRSDGGVFLLNEVKIQFGDSVKIVGATASFNQKHFHVSGSIDGRKETAWGVHPQRGRKHHANFWFEKPTTSAQLTMELHQYEGWRMEIGRFRLFALTGKPEREPLPAEIRRILQTSKRSASQRETLANHFLTVAPSLKKLNDRLRELEQNRERLFEQTMVMQENSKMRPTHVLDRGQYDQRRELVTAGVPSSLPPLAKKNSTRLDLARWLVNGKHPLTARVTVNRIWQMLFGHGLVRTSEDFGSQGEPPSHPKLLDWLATEFVRMGWDRKRLIKLIVSSATYQQTSRATDDLLQRDPQNRLLARGPRFRLSAELIRDNALSASGLLIHRLGGPSVKPYQPSGLWVAGSHWPRLFDQQRYVADQAENLVRRSVYTFVKRTSPHPTMTTFDATNREVCSMRRSRTNTPLQALVLLNDPQFVEASRALAERALTRFSSTKERLSFLVRCVLARNPSRVELAILTRGLTSKLSHYQAHPAEASLLLRVGSLPRNQKLDAAQHAAWTVIASTVMNLHEAITRE